jgi:hypothetical protein
MYTIKLGASGILQINYRLVPQSLQSLGEQHEAGFRPTQSGFMNVSRAVRNVRIDKTEAHAVAVRAF